MSNLKFYRVKKGLTLERLSDSTGLSVGYLSHLEKGTRENPSKATMEKISASLDESINDIFFNEINPDEGGDVIETGHN